MFDDLVKMYNLEDEDLSYKYKHSFRVKDNMAVLAKNMSLPIKDVNLAMFIGLFHDYGRFPQYDITGGFDDKLLDHGDYGANYLKEHIEVMDFYNIDKKDYEIVYKAIKNHNKYNLEDTLSKRELLFCNMLRDCDKLDILYAIGNIDIKKVLYEDNLEISKLVKDTFYQRKLIPKNIYNNLSDRIVGLFSYVFDINFYLSIEMIKYNNYFSKIYDRLKNKDMYKEYFEFVNKYIREEGFKC